MKQGCLLLLAVIAISAYGYWNLIESTEIADQYWIPAVLGILSAIVFANFHGIVLALKHIKASKRPQMDWKDGDLVVISGRIQTKNSMLAPISAKAVAIAEYEICHYETRRSNGKTQTVKTTDYRGCLMTPCFIQTTSGSINIVGFPLLTQWQTQTFKEPQNYKNVADFLTVNQSTILPKSPMAAIAELNKVLKDDDGIVNVNYRNEHAQDLLNLGDLEIENIDPKADLDLDTSVQSESPKFSPSEGLNLIIINFLKNKDYTLEETVIENGIEVTAMGSYIASKRQINIGSGLSELSHAIYKGAARRVLGSNLRKAIIFSIIFAGIFTAANYFLLKEIGINPQQIIEKWGDTAMKLTES